MKTRRTVLEGLLSVASGAGMSAISRAGDPPARLEVGDASIEVSFDSDPFDLGQAALLEWVMQAARAATAYFGRFPVAHARVPLLQSPGRALPTGWVSATAGRDGGTWGGPGAPGRSTGGQHVAWGDLDEDWVLAQEMFHVGLPSVERRHH